ncbi:uncharacterized protein LOC118432820 [Branchiostoma floridae]|uniref:Uncharacterized protein LOC118432820 n=1 Tax=Branchiostoma floridae TaxID=7739 RepID=A0A9J7MFL2_BRAFL|nr:uncharacterized protein LOC118432820 [Branchiostoma floridae]
MFPVEQADGGSLALQEKRLLQQEKDRRLHTRRKSVPANSNTMLWHHRRAAMFFEEQKLKKQLDHLEFEERESKIKLRNMERELRSDLRRMQMELRARTVSGTTNQGLRLPTGIVVTDEHGDDCEVEFLSLARTTYSRETQVSSCFDSMRPASIRQEQNTPLSQYVLPGSPPASSTESTADNVTESAYKLSKRCKAKTLASIKTTPGERVVRRPRSLSLSNTDPFLPVPSPDTLQGMSRERAASIDSLSTFQSEHSQNDLSDPEESEKTSYTPLYSLFLLFLAASPLSCMAIPAHKAEDVSLEEFFGASLSSRHRRSTEDLPDHFHSYLSHPPIAWDNGVAERAMCPWTYEHNFNATRFPHTITMADRSDDDDRCLDNGVRRVGTVCLPVLVKLNVWARDGDDQWQRAEELVPVGYTCATPRE